MAADFKPLLTSRYGIDQSWSLAAAQKAGAYKVARRALTMMKPEVIKEEVKKASIRG